jgi:hypothetical protein
MVSFKVRPDISWTDLLKESKDITDDSSNSTAVVEFLRPLIQIWYDQLSTYAQEMTKSMEDKTSAVLSSCPCVKMKDLVVQTRAALRFGLFYMTPRQEDKTMLHELQNLAIVQGNWAEPLMYLLSQRRGDDKCRLLAAQLLCNMITSNTETASLVASIIPLSPSPEAVTWSIQKSLSDPIISTTTTTATTTTALHSDAIVKPNWVDMILFASKSKNRQTLAALVATIHNCIVVLDHRPCLTVTESTSELHFAKKVASNTMLLNTLLRHFVTAETVVKTLKGYPIVHQDNPKNSTNQAITNLDTWDSATEWIHLLFSKLAKLGLLPFMYRSIGCTTNTVNQSTVAEIDETVVVVVPEHLVLLHCMAMEADAFVMESGSNKIIANPFGGEAGEDETLRNYVFLATLASNLSLSIKNTRENPFIKGTEDDESMDGSLLVLGYIIVLDILRSTLGVDSATITKVRLNLGEQTSLLQESAIALGAITDIVAEQISGKKARDVRLKETEQQLLKNLVCLLGNLCYQCKHNQDLLRSTLVPYLLHSDNNDSVDQVSRNGLHVLLSCTSYATSCFTLREWGVIAIRNALEDHTENQAVVAELVAQDPVQSADLQNAGIRVQLDSKGKVTLSKIDGDKDKIRKETEDNDTN